MTSNLTRTERLAAGAAAVTFAALATVGIAGAAITATVDHNDPQAVTVGDVGEHALVPGQIDAHRTVRCRDGYVRVTTRWWIFASGATCAPLTGYPKGSVR